MPSLTLYASLLQNDLGARDGGAVSLAYLLQVGVDEALDARFHAGSLLSKQVPSRCHALCSCARAVVLVVALEVGDLRWVITVVISARVEQSAKLVVCSLCGRSLQRRKERCRLLLPRRFSVSMNVEEGPVCRAHGGIKSRGGVSGCVTFKLRVFRLGGVVT